MLSIAKDQPAVSSLTAKRGCRHPDGPNWQLGGRMTSVTAKCLGRLRNSRLCLFLVSSYVCRDLRHNDAAKKLLSLGEIGKITESGAGLDWEIFAGAPRMWSLPNLARKPFASFH
jgi:hypothetical protein